MRTKFASALYILVMMAIIVGVDVLFLRHRITERLLSNVAIVLVFVVLYFSYVKRR